MKKVIFTLLGLLGAVNVTTAQCSVIANVTPNTVVCGESVVLSAFGSSTGSLVLDEDFDTGGFGPGWSSTPGATSFSNPCSPAGVNGTPHAWMDDNTSVPRALTSAPYDLSGATAGVTICFDMMFATQGDASPCEGPDEPDEGVFLQYSIDGGSTWIDITYFDPNGGNDPQLTTWNNYCFQLPAAAVTGNTMIQWFQSADSGAEYDHWGIDNVQIFMNDVTSEIVWQHDGYSYGIGNGGGDNPTPVIPTVTTTYTVEMTTGTGAVCSQDVTVTVTSPTFDVNVVTPPSICSGDCATITGTAQIIQDPGGIETYENNEFELVASGSAGVNINVQGINTNSMYTGLIQNVIINGFDFSGSFICTSFGGCPCGTGSVGFGASCDLDPSSFTVTLTSPGGCTMVLAPAGIAGGNYSNTVFVPVGGSAFGTPFPNGGTWDPEDPFTNMNGCDPNGVWTLSFDAPGLGFGIGTLTGWSITFDDPAIYQPVCTSWDPTADLTAPASINTDACPLVSTDYTLTVSNCIPGCPTYEEVVSIVVGPCGCTPPSIIISPLQACSPLTVDLSSAIGAASDPATLSYHLTQTDAQNATNAISSVVSVSGSYWVRAEDPADPACFLEYEIVVTIDNLSYSTSLIDESCGAGDGQITITATSGVGPYTFSIDGGTTTQASGVFPNLTAGTFNIQVIDNTTGCLITGTENISNAGGPTVDLITPTDPTCNGDCDGSITVTVSGGTTPYSYQWYDGLGNPIGTDAITITGLCAGNYSVDVSDVAALCPANSTVILNDPALIDPTFVLTDFCEGTANSASGIVTSGGTFAFNPLPVGTETIDAATGEIINGIGGTQYSIEYTTPVGSCQTTLIQTVNVNASPVPVITGAFTYCLGGNSTLDAGAGYVDYDWSTGDLTQTITTFAQNGITVTVTDANGCIGTSAPVNVIETSVITTNDIIEICQGGSAVIHGNTETIANTYSQTFVSVSGCDSISNIDLIVNALPIPSITGPTSFCQGGDVTLDAGGPFVTYNWSVGGTTQTITSTANSGITVTVEDANGCVGTSTAVDVVELLPIVYDSLITICGGGSAIIFGNNETTVGVYSELNIGINGCDSITNITLAIELNPVIDVMNIVEESCLGDDDGTIDVASVTNGTGTYTYAWSIVPDPGTSFVNNLTPGSYTVTVVDANTTCQTDSTVTLNAGVICCTVAVDTNGTISPSCSQADGSIDAFGIAGDGNYTFSINNGVFIGNGLFENLSAGNYEIVVMDGSGTCTDTINVQLADLNAPSITSSTPTDLLCNGSLDGEVDIIATGGVGALDYEVTDGVFTDNNGTGQFINLAAGNYTITVTDINGCTVTDNVIINEPTPVFVDVNNSNILCFGDATGSITLSGNGGVGTYTYSIDNGVTWSTNVNFTNLTAQNYDVIAEDANGCQSVAQLTIITEPSQLTIDISATDEVCFNACDGSITWAGIGGTAPYVFALNGNIENASPVQNLCSGTQNYNLADDLGCSISGTIDVLPAVEIIPGLITVVDDGCEEFCSGEVTVTSNTGVSYTLGGVTNVSGIFTGLCASTYVVIIEDANGCFVSTSVVVNTAEKAIANFSFTPSYLTTLNNEVQFFNSSINADAYLWEITGPNGFTDNISDEDFSYIFPADTGVYTICLTAINTAGCSDVVCHSIIVREELIIYVPNAFTPDGDEFNENFKAIVSGIDIYDFDFYIFDRWGELIWESHDVEQGWNGTYKGELVQTGIYTWKITVKDVYEDDRKEFVGHVSVLK